MRKRLALAILTLLITMAAAPAVAAQEGPSVTINPDTTLEDGDKIDVTGTGFPAGAAVFIMLCNGDERLGDSVGRCSLIGSGSTGYLVDSAGGFVGANVAVPVGQVGASDLATCPPSPAQAARGVTCEIQVVTSDLGELAGVDVTYEGQAPAAPNELAFTGLRGTAFIRVGFMLVIIGVVFKGAAFVLRREPTGVAAGT